MASKQEIQSFISQVGPSFKKYGSQKGFTIFSFAIAQACLESGYGTSGPARQKNNILGIGPGMYFSSWDECVKGYYDRTVLGKSDQAKNAKTIDEYFNAFVASGYLEGDQQSYYNQIKSIITANNLTQYDGAGAGGFSTGGAAAPVSYPSIDDSENGTKWTEAYPNRPIAWIVIHYTAGSRNDTPLGTCKYWKGADRKGSADYVVGRDGTIARYNKDYKNRFCYNCGVYGVRGDTSKCTNQNSIGIENCNAPGEGPFTEAQKNALKNLVNAIMYEFNIPADHVIRHCDVYNTDCPQPYNNQTQEHEAAWKELHSFITTMPSGTSGTGGWYLHKYTREDAIALEFAYWDQKNTKATKSEQPYKLSALNYGDMLSDIGFTLGGGSSGGIEGYLASEVKTQSGKILNSGTWKEMPAGVAQTGMVANFTQYIRNWAGGTTQRTLYDLWNQKGKSSSHTVCTIDGYALIAPGRYFSNSCGDLLEVVLEDGTKFIAIVGDTKGGDTKNEYGHPLGNGVDVIEWEFNGPASKASAGSDQAKLRQGLQEWGILGKKVKGMTNYGTYFQ